MHTEEERGGGISGTRADFVRVDVADENLVRGLVGVLALLEGVRGGDSQERAVVIEAQRGDGRRVRRVLIDALPFERVPNADAAIAPTGSKRLVQRVEGEGIHWEYDVLPRFLPPVAFERERLRLLHVVVKVIHPCSAFHAAEGKATPVREALYAPRLVLEYRLPPR